MRDSILAFLLVFFLVAALSVPVGRMAYAHAGPWALAFLVLPVVSGVFEIVWIVREVKR